jgi:hypothetical protein
MYVANRVWRGDVVVQGSGIDPGLNLDMSLCFQLKVSLNGVLAEIVF